MLTPRAALPAKLLRLDENLSALDHLFGRQCDPAPHPIVDRLGLMDQFHRPFDVAYGRPYDCRRVGWEHFLCHSVAP